MRGRHVKYRWLVPDFGFFFPRPLRYGIVIHAVGIGIGEEDCGSKSSPWQRHTILKYQYPLDDPSHFFIRHSEFFPLPPWFEWSCAGPESVRFVIIIITFYFF